MSERERELRVEIIRIRNLIGGAFIQLAAYHVDDEGLELIQRLLAEIDEGRDLAYPEEA